MDTELMNRILARARADLARGEVGVAEALALAWHEPDLRADRDHQVAVALGRQSEILSRVRTTIGQVRKELDSGS